MTTDDLLIYKQTVVDTGIVPEPIYAKCKILVAFTYRLPMFSTPGPGKKPIRKRKR